MPMGWTRWQPQKNNKVRLMDMNDENHVDDLLQQVYDEAFDDAYTSFVMRRQRDPLFTRDFLQGLLNSMYVQQGNNWVGRGQTKETAHNALIAAAELVYSQWDQLQQDGSVVADASSQSPHRC